MPIVAFDRFEAEQLNHFEAQNMADTPRYTRNEPISDDEEDVRDVHSDVAEISTYRQSRGPSSNAYADGTSHYDSSLSSRLPQQPTGEGNGEFVGNAYTDEESLHRYMSRFPFDEPRFPQSDTRTHPAREQHDGGIDQNHRSLVPYSTPVDDYVIQRRERNHARELGRQQTDRDAHVQRVEDREHHHAERELDRLHGGRRNSGTAHNDKYASSFIGQRIYEHTPANVRDHRRVCFPAYQYR